MTTRTDEDPAQIAHLMFSRRQENFFRYMRQRYDLDGLHAYTTTPDDPNRTVPTPRAPTRTATSNSCPRRSSAPRPATTVTPSPASPPPVAVRPTTVCAEIAPARIELARLDAERKRIHDTVRMAVSNTESALARLLADHYARAGQEARTLLAEIYTAPADPQIVGGQLHVRINPLSAPRRPRALAGLCNDLTATRTVYPGTDPTLVYTVKDA